MRSETNLGPLSLARSARLPLPYTGGLGVEGGMLSLEDMAAWTLDEIRAHIRRFLPEGHTFHFGQDDGWKARLESPDGEILWERTGLDERVLLLDAFGWLWVRRQGAPSVDSPWGRRKGPEQKLVEQPPVQIPDPEDLDPAEVMSVYEAARKKT